MRSSHPPPAPRNEHTSEPIGSIAARYADHPDPNVRRMAMSLLTQRPNRHPTPSPRPAPLGGVARLLAEGAPIEDTILGSACAPPGSVAEVLARVWIDSQPHNALLNLYPANPPPGSPASYNALMRKRTIATGWSSGDDT